MYIVAKENSKAPEGWSYFKEFELVDNQLIPINTIIFEQACVFSTKEEAAAVYWRICQFFYGYRIYPQFIIRGKKNYV